MSRFLPALTALTLALAAGTAGAQPLVGPPPVGRPPTSPYSTPVLPPVLNLFNRGNPAINYYGLVQPQTQQAQQLQTLQFGLNRTAAEVAAADQAAADQAATAPGAVPATGHTAGFMTYSRYFNTVNPRGR